MNKLENKHLLTKGIIPRNPYDKKLLHKLNEEYRSKPVIASFTSYDDNSQLKQAEQRLKNLSLLHDIRGKKVLEIGCGGGYVSYILARDYECDVVGIDIYESNKWRKLNSPKLVFHDLDLAETNPFKEESFDLIISYVAWEHMRHPFEVLRQASKLLKKSTGCLYIFANLYRSAIASHLYRNIFFPFPHLLFCNDLLVKYALEVGVEQWWIDAFYYINKLTYAEYKEYFSLLDLKIKHEKKVIRALDWEFYKRFEDKLGLYPISDLETDFFEVLLRRGDKPTFSGGHLFMSSIQIESKKKYFKNSQIKVSINAEGEGLQYAWYVFRNGEKFETIWYQKEATLLYLPKEAGVYFIRGFVRDTNGNKISKDSRTIAIVN